MLNRVAESVQEELLASCVHQRLAKHAGTWHVTGTAKGVGVAGLGGIPQSVSRFSLTVVF